MDAITEYLNNLDTATLLAWAWKVLAALLIFVIGRWVAKAVSAFLARLMRKRGIDDMLSNFLSAILYAILLVAVIIAAVSQLGIQTTPLVAVLGAAGLAVGLALQNSLGNFASGVMLVLFRPFTRGDFVEAGGTSGTVEEVGIFNTVLNTPDNRRIIVPNGQITSDSITNYSAYDTRRIDLIIGVGYGDDLKIARDTIDRTLRAHDKVLEDPEPAILVMELADSSVNFAVRPWVLSSDYWVVRGELLEAIKAELEAAGCEIPFPQRDVHLHQAESD
ncbi:mechanosensitive ion channel [Wenzhouxiangella sp. XN79A]|uniref:mechanosensitive ion channel family protein n=1 Tax=Wenzhouxiangella sp. XN79A TaxID=2724193 RepID=UPI00144AD172|nr:mechanosensitive ion channel domain-containing protein [Wenzhouxiangella sp. XN79A]NKI33739.1 mechanosensitive ion channel [Wenzhouxiangella sp. XN79A]